MMLVISCLYDDCLVCFFPSLCDFSSGLAFMLLVLSCLVLMVRVLYLLWLSCLYDDCLVLSL